MGEVGGWVGMRGTYVGAQPAVPLVEEGREEVFAFLLCVEVGERGLEGEESEELEGHGLSGLCGVEVGGEGGGEEGRFKDDPAAEWRWGPCCHAACGWWWWVCWWWVWCGGVHR